MCATLNSNLEEYSLLIYAANLLDIEIAINLLYFDSSNILETLAT